MAYTETTTTSYGGRIWNSIKGVGLGFTLIVSATVLLWWNEGESLHTAQDIAEVSNAAIHVESMGKLAPSGQLIHGCGTAVTGDTLEDSDFGIALNALCIERKVSYYQWTEKKHTETKEKANGSKEEITTYTYHKEWKDNPVNSSNFHDSNYRYSNFTLANLTFNDLEGYPLHVSLGAYKLPRGFFKEIASKAKESTEPFEINLQVVESINQTVSNTQGTSATVSTNPNDPYQWVHVSNREIYIGQDASNPAVGDISIEFTAKEPSVAISVVAVAKGDSLSDYRTKNKNNRHYITQGTKSLDEMMENAESDNNLNTWIRRLIGLVLVFFGFKGILDILVSIFAIVPIVKNLVSAGVNVLCGVLAIVYTLIIVVVAWIFYRTLLLGAILAGVFGAVVYWLWSKSKKAQYV